MGKRRVADRRMHGMNTLTHFRGSQRPRRRPHPDTPSPSLFCDYLRRTTRTYFCRNKAEKKAHIAINFLSIYQKFIHCTSQFHRETEREFFSSSSLRQLQWCTFKEWKRSRHENSKQPNNWTLHNATLMVISWKCRINGMQETTNYSA